MKNNKPIVMLLPKFLLPIPAVDGGAIETLITSLIEENEIEQRVFFVIASKYSKEAKKRKYKFSKIYYFKNDRRIGIKGRLEWLKEVFFKIWDKIFHNHITIKLFGNAVSRDYLANQLFKIGKNEKIDFVLLEAFSNERLVSEFRKIVGENGVCIHIHFTRKEDISVRKLINNSISISKFVRDEWVKDKSILGYNEVLYNGIDVSLFSQKFSEETKTTLREKLGFSREDIIVIFVGRIYEVKGITELLDAFDIIAEDNIKLLLIGGCPVGFGGEYVEYVKNRIAKIEKVKYLGYISNDALPLYYAISDIQVIPSICQEGAGLVAIEGMAQGLPLIITKSGGMPEYVSENCSVQIPIDCDLSKNLAQAIIGLAHNGEKRIEMAHNAVINARKFDKHEYYNNFINLIYKHIK